MAVDTNVLKPKTLAGIKSLAKRLKKERGIQHSRALDAAAVQAGFRDYHQAHRLLAAGETAS